MEKWTDWSFDSGNGESWKSYKKLEHEDEIDDERWNSIREKRLCLAKDTKDTKCICTRLKEFLENNDYDQASELQIIMARESQNLAEDYQIYAFNIIEWKGGEKNCRWEGGSFFFWFINFGYGVWNMLFCLKKSWQTKAWYIYL